MDRLYFEDFSPGAVHEYGDTEVSAVRIKAFASQFDPQPFHLDEGAARETMAGGLIDSMGRTNFETTVDRLQGELRANSPTVRDLPPDPGALS